MLKGLINVGLWCTVVVFLDMFMQNVNSIGNETNIVELECLSGLPVDHLLKIRRALQLLSAESNGELNFEHGVIPVGEVRDAVMEMRNLNRSDITALPLVGSHIKKMGWDTWAEEKPTKIQKFFQLSVTALAFLAFGGYLLCMIVQAIKSKGTTYYYPTLQSLVSSTNRKRRPNRRQRRTTWNNSTETIVDRLDVTAAEPSPDDLYQVLILAAEGYVHLNDS